MLLVACSNLPPRGFPPLVDHHVIADCIADAHGRLRVPASDDLLVVYELSATPTARAERFGALGERWLVYPAGTAVRIECRFRTYGPPGTWHDPRTHLPSASRMQVVPLSP